ncbi:MAG: hypothetical protein NC314_10900 [Roseburia sp.]|nr:hypothetical protein [Roseburia sp.]MCM1243341.1 hypothetical protein [Roseburia sp.]
MTTIDYLDRLLVKYAGTFDIYQPYVIHGKEYPAYGYFFSHTEKYVLVRSANMWSSDCYEHILFMETEEITQDTLKEAYAIVKDYMEPVLVRKGKEQPEPNHMYSYLTIALIAQKSVSGQMKKAVRKFKFEKGYQFSMRGFSQAHIVCASLEDEKVCANFAARSMKKVFQKVFEEVKSGKPGFSQIREKENIPVHQQA